MSDTHEPVVSELIDLLTLERLEDNLFRGQSRDIGTKYVFGGQVLGQALSAAQATVDNGRHVHSLHAYFLRAGNSPLRHDTADLYALAALLLEDPEDLMHKAVGWSLREAGKRVDVDELRRFLDRYAAAMPRMALRYAIEHFDEAERRHYRALR